MFATATDDKSSYRTSKSTVLLITVFILGYLDGRGRVYSDSFLYALLISQAVRSSASALGLFLCTLFPVFITTLIYSTRRTEFYVLQCILQAFFYGIISGSIELAFGSMRWLICPLLLFSTTVTLLALLCFWLRLISGRRINSRNGLFFCYIISFIVFILDFFLISPFVANLSYI